MSHIPCHIGFPQGCRMYWRRLVFGAPSLFMRKISMCICRAWICRQTPQLVRSGPRMLSVFLGGTLGNSKKAISKVPWTSMSRSCKVFPTTIHAILFTLLSHPRCPTSAIRRTFLDHCIVDCPALVSSDSWRHLVQGAHAQECRRVLYTPSNPRIDDRMEIQFCQYPRNFKLLPPTITEKVRTFCYPVYF